MEHIIITELSNGMLHLKPEVGYSLYNENSQRLYAEAVVKSAKGFRTVLDGISPEPHERTLADAKKEKLAALAEYAEGAKCFYVGNTRMWVGPDKRANLKNAAEAMRANGAETVPFAGATLPIQAAFDMLTAVEYYAAMFSIVEDNHKATIQAKRAIHTVDEYDFTVGFPEPLHFNL